MSKAITVHDPLQDGYQYERTYEPGTNFDAVFTPDLTPRQMLDLGVFGGAYFEGHVGEYPTSWFTASAQSTVANPEQNFFQVAASQPLEVWRQKGWIYEEDPRGWFQWYCRYYLGRRLPEEDQRQMGRWRAMRRHIGQIKSHCTPGDQLCRRKQRQALLHWAYDSRSL